MAIDKIKQGRNSKARAKGYEREVARMIGGKRHLADTGGPEDVLHPEFAIQVKSGLKVGSVALRDGMALAKLAALTSHKLPAVALVDRSGTRLGYYLCFELQAFADWFDYGEKESAA